MSALAAWSQFGLRRSEFRVQALACSVGRRTIEQITRDVTHMLRLDDDMNQGGSLLFAALNHRFKTKPGGSLT